MRMRLLHPFFLAGLLCTPALVIAQNQFSLGTLEQGQLMLNLNITEQQSVEQDTLNANLSFVVQGRNRSEIQNELNSTMKEALDLLNAAAGLNYQTSQYQVYIVETNRPSKTDLSNPVWRARQSVQITSVDSVAMLETVGQLQNLGMTLSGLNYSLSPARYEEVSAQLLQAALAKLQNRAESAAVALGKSRAELVEVSMDGSPNFGGYRERGAVFAMAADSTMATPVADPGETNVSVSVSARAVLSP